jgi:hypothetical protein
VGFRPGLRDGMPVPVMVDIEVNFRLGRGRGEWALTRAVFNPPEGATRPVVTAAPYPDIYTPAGRKGHCFVRCRFKRHRGKPSHRKIFGSGARERSDPHRARVAIPAGDEGRPAGVCSMHYGVCGRRCSLDAAERHRFHAKSQRRKEELRKEQIGNLLF